MFPLLILLFLILHELIAFKLVNIVSLKLPKLSNIHLVMMEPQAIIYGLAVTFSMELGPSTW